MFFRRRCPSLLMLLLALLGLGFLGKGWRRRCHHDDDQCKDRRARARRKFREGFDILLSDPEPEQAAPAADETAPQ